MQSSDTLKVAAEFERVLILIPRRGRRKRHRNDPDLSVGPLPYNRIVKRFPAAIAALFWLAPAQAQDVTVAGRVLDAGTGTPVSFATVTVLREGVAVGGELADEDGRFVIEGLERGTYTVHLGFVGYTAA